MAALGLGVDIRVVSNVRGRVTVAVTLCLVAARHEHRPDPLFQVEGRRRFAAKHTKSSQSVG
jgi:hypothetical protein